MRIFSTCLLVLVLSLPQAGAAQSTGATKALRMLIAANPDFDPTNPFSEREAMYEVLDLVKKNKPLEAYGKILEFDKIYPVSVLSNLMALKILEILADNKQGSALPNFDSLPVVHRAVLDAIRYSITGDSECLREEDACKVISLQEIVHVMREAGFQEKSHSFTLLNGVPYRVVKAAAKDGKERTYFFDISTFPASLQAK